jgi:hypothetical protein
MAPSRKLVVDRHSLRLELAGHHPAGVIWAAGGKLLSHPAGVMCRASQTPIFGYVTECCDLYVVDTSFFPSIGAMNPALTAMANAIRVGDHLMSRMA